MFTWVRKNICVMSIYTLLFCRYYNLNHNMFQIFCFYIKFLICPVLREIIINSLYLVEVHSKSLSLLPLNEEIIELRNCLYSNSVIWLKTLISNSYSQKHVLLITVRGSTWLQEEKYVEIGESYSKLESIGFKEHWDSWNTFLSVLVTWIWVSY